MSKLRSRVVNPLSLMTDIFVEHERLTRALAELRDALVTSPDDDWYIGLHEARGHHRRIGDELKALASLVSLNARRKSPPGPAPEPPTSPSSPPSLPPSHNLKLVS
jgi:hypothetical protein